MDIEQLNKSQIVLLTLLVSFVTSIATGIVTVSLMDQAPPAVAQTVNRIIEHTIQTVAATTTPRGQAAATVVTQEKTVVVKEADMISQAVAKLTPSLVRIYSSDAQGSVFLGLGLVLDTKGTIVTDTAALDEHADATLVLSDGTHVRAFVVSRDNDADLAYLLATTTEGAAPLWKPATIASDHPLLGESLVALSGKSVARIATGIITALPPAADDGIQFIDTDIASENLLPGTPIVNTDGNVVGVSTGASRASYTSGFVSALILIPPSPPATNAKK
jgi:S1-C subfamily serine protease